MRVIMALGCSESQDFGTFAGGFVQPSNYFAVSRLQILSAVVGGPTTFPAHQLSIIGIIISGVR